MPAGLAPRLDAPLTTRLGLRLIPRLAAVLVAVPLVPAAFSSSAHASVTINCSGGPIVLGELAEEYVVTGASCPSVTITGDSVYATLPPTDVLVIESDGVSVTASSIGSLTVNGEMGIVGATAVGDAKMIGARGRLDATSVGPVVVDGHTTAVTVTGDTGEALITGDGSRFSARSTGPMRIDAEVVSIEVKRTIEKLRSDGSNHEIRARAVPRFRVRGNTVYSIVRTVGTAKILGRGNVLDARTIDKLTVVGSSCAVSSDRGRTRVIKVKGRGNVIDVRPL